MMLTDTLICGAITYTAVVLGICAAVGWRRALRENRRLKGWVKHWRQQAEEMAAALARAQSTSRRGQRARASQIERDRARIAATTARLKVGK